MAIKISAKKFEALVVQALEELPEFFQDRLQNIEVLITDWPTEGELEAPSFFKVIGTEFVI